MEKRISSAYNTPHQFSLTPDDMQEIRRIAKSKKQLVSDTIEAIFYCGLVKMSTSLFGAENEV